MKYKFLHCAVIYLLLLLPVDLLWGQLASGEPAISDSLLKVALKTQNIDVLNNVFIHMERLRSQHIQQLILSCLSDSSKRQVLNLRHRLDELMHKAEKMEQRHGGTPPSDSLQAYKSEIDSYRQNVVNRFPEFTCFFGLHDSLSVRYVQMHLIGEKQAVVEWWVQNQRLLALIISKDTVAIVPFRQTAAEIFASVRQFNNILYAESDPTRLHFSPSLAYELYRSLIAPVEPFLGSVHTIVMIPCRELWGLPFECLITKPSPTGLQTSAVLYDEYRYFRYLIYRYAISYNVTVMGLADALIDMNNRKGLGRRLLSMSTPVINYIDADSEWYRRYQENIPYIEQEVQRIARRMWRHERLTGTAAKRSVLVDRSRDFRWIHLSLPAVIDANSPKQSFITFSGDIRQPETILRVSDALRCRFAADQIILSRSTLGGTIDSVNTGMAIFPHALLLGGARSVLWSRWQISGNTAARFMGKFYWELKYKRQTNVLALQGAKIDALGDSFIHDGVEISRAHPYFWASYTLMGNVNIRPPTFSTVPPYLVIIIVYLIVGVVSLIIVRKTVDTKTE